MTSINILFWNAGGLNMTKFTELQTIISRQIADVFAIVEAGASTDNDRQYCIKGYNTYILKRNRQVASGIIVGVKNELTVQFRILHRMEEQNKFEAVETDVWVEKRKLKLIFAYNPPNNIPPVDLLESRLNNHSIIIGDFNAPSSKWGYGRTTQVGSALEDFVDSNLVEYMPGGRPSFISFKGETSNPDIVLTHVNLVNSTMVNVLESPTGYGHRIMHIASCLKKRSRGKALDTQPRWNFKKARWEAYAALTDQLLTKSLISEKNPDKSCREIFKIIRKCALQTIPRGQTKRYKPFWTDQLAKLKVERDCARIKAERTGSLQDSIELRRKQAILTKTVAEAKKNCFNKFLSSLDCRRDGKKAFSFLNQLLNENGKQRNEPLIVNGKEIVGNAHKASAMAKYYAAVGRLEARKLPNIENKHSCLTWEEEKCFNSLFNLQELRRAESKMKPGKCAGPDDIPWELLLKLGPKAKEVLLLFLNSCWKYGIPSDWRKAEIVPVLKKDKPPSDPASYRPIALTNSCCKLMERMIVNRLNCYIEDGHFLSDCQAGFRKKRDTIEQVTFFTEMVKDGFQRKQSTIGVFVDFKAAYDLVWRKLLVQKLQKLGISGNMLHWLKSFLTQRFARVKYNGRKSNYVQSKNGLPQGAVISCTLFNIMINDLITTLEEIPGVNCLLFADDLVVYATSSNISGITSVLNIALGRLSQWCKNNQMVVNTQKTVCQLYTLSTKQHAIDIKYNDQNIEVENTVKYLGVHLDKRMTWRKHAEKLSASGEARLRLLKRLAGVTWGASQGVLGSTYRAYVRPALEYGGEFLSTASDATCKIVDKVQNKALRIVTGGAKSTPITAMEIQASIEPLTLRREARTIRLVEKVKRLPVKHWKEYKPACQRLSSQTSLLRRADELRDKYDLAWTNREAFRVPTAADLNLKLATGNLQLHLDVRKEDAPIHQLKALSLEVIDTRYPRDS